MNEIAKREDLGGLEALCNHLARSGFFKDAGDVSKARPASRLPRVAPGRVGPVGRAERRRRAVLGGET